MKMIGLLNDIVDTPEAAENLVGLKRGQAQIDLERKIAAFHEWRRQKELIANYLAA